MPRGRILNKKISQDDKVANLSLEATLLYTWCIPYLDVKGRMYGDVWTLKSVVPNIKELTPQKIETCIQEWINNDLVIYYGNNQKYLEFKGFLKNQTINEDRESESDIPTPDKIQTKSGENPDELTAKDKVKYKVKDKDSNVKIQCIYDLFIKSFNKNPNQYKLTPSRKKKIECRLADAGKEMLCKAIENTAQSSFHRGDNDTKWEADLDFIIRNYEQVERLSNLKGDNKGKRVELSEDEYWAEESKKSF